MNNNHLILLYTHYKNDHSKKRHEKDRIFELVYERQNQVILGVVFCFMDNFGLSTCLHLYFSQDYSVAICFSPALFHFPIPGERGTVILCVSTLNRVAI